MNILSETGGQSCNKFWQYLFYLKQAIGKGEKLYVQLPDKTIEDYPNLLDNPYLRFPFYSHWLTTKIGIKRSLETTRRFTVLFFNNYCRFLYHQLSFRQINFLDGKPTWNLEVDYTDIKPILRRLFDLNKSKKEKIDQRIDTLGVSDCVLIGCHIRGGDYRTWKGGKYFFTQYEYRMFLDKILGLFPNKRVFFYISTNEKLDESAFTGLEYIHVNDASATQDLYALSRCKYLIGTLSSFNMWISLVYDIPLYTILSKDDLSSMTIDDFSVVETYYRKKNGFRFPRTEEFFSSRHQWLYSHSNHEAELLKKFSIK